MHCPCMSSAGRPLRAGGQGREGSGSAASAAAHLRTRRHACPCAGRQQRAARQCLRVQAVLTAEKSELDVSKVGAHRWGDQPCP